MSERLLYCFMLASVVADKPVRVFNYSEAMNHFGLTLPQTRTQFELAPSVSSGIGVKVYYVIALN